MMTHSSKDSLYYDDQSKVVSFFQSQCFLKEVENICPPCFFGVIETREEVWESVSLPLSSSSKLSQVFLLNN